MNCATDVGERLNSIIDYFISAEIMYVIFNLTHFQSHTLPISHNSNLTYFQSHTLPISHSSNLTLFQSHTLSGLHYSNLTLNYGFGKKKIVNYFPHTLLHLLDMQYKLKFCFYQLLHLYFFYWPQTPARLHS